MNMTQLSTIFNYVTRRAREVLIIKNKEYASKEDVLSNFDRAAAMLGTTPEYALLAMLNKHIVSIYGMLDLGKNNIAEAHAIELWEEKLTDIQCYLTLLEALIRRRKGLPDERQDKTKHRCASIANGDSPHQP